jgi:NAD(P)-dependent dehydrogenase (short-subunit alcohol dehydrogenase family)
VSPDGGRVVLITGASRGIGRASARWFAERGHTVLAASRTGEGPEGPGLVPLACDVADQEQVEAAFARAEAEVGPVQIVVANAGITRDTLALRMDDDAWQEVLSTNLTGAFRVARRGLAKMVRARFGRIVFLSSVGAFVGLPGQANYAASKAGLVGLARALAREVGSRGITVNVVAPGVIDTDMTAALGPDRLAQLTAMVPAGRAGTPDDVAAAVGWLASDEAAYVTGAVLPVDGGLGMGW